MIDTIIFDLDGVICSTDHYHYLAWKKLSDELHISFDEKSGDFYELIRSSTPTGIKPQIIATRFPYDEIKKPFSYVLYSI